MQPGAQTLAIVVPALLAAIAAIASAITAGIAARLQKRSASADAFIRISDRFESPEFRAYRKTIYGLDRTAFAQWSPVEQSAVDAWCAHIDLASALAESRQLGKLLFLYMYGDVMLRTIYQIAPYCNEQARIRGAQFLLPTRIFTDDLVKLWRKQARRRKYPLTIGFPAQPYIRMNPDLFDSDDELMRFRGKKTR